MLDYISLSPPLLPSPLYFLGKVHIHFSDLPNGQEDDKWHQLLQIGGGAKAAPKGSLRLVANFKDHMILPLEEYDKLKQVSYILCIERGGERITSW